MANKNGGTEPSRKTGRHLKIAIPIILAVLIAVGLIGRVAFRDAPGAPDRQATFVAQRGPLTISVLESGTIKARDQIIIKNEVEGKTSIISLVPEGTLVKSGDLLVELDGSGLEDEKIDQEIRVQNAEAAQINAQENLAVVRNQAASDTDKAELTLQFAQQDLKQYKQGEYPNALAAAKNRITLAQEELTRARETLKWSQKLYAEKYISQTELQADQLAEKRKALDLELATNDLELLQNYTYHRKIAQVESDVSQARMALERTMRKATADIVQAEADLKAKKAEYNRQKEKLAKIADQIKKTKIYAPAAGLVIYATSAQRGGFRNNVEPLDEGQEVRERQELIYLPTTESAMAEITVHESNLAKVHIGQRATITVDALPGRKFSGYVATIAPLPDAQSMWMNPDLKVYNTEIFLDETDSALRTGISCQAEIIIERYENAVYIPVQAVLRVKGEPTVFVLEGEKSVPRRVEIGLDNNRMIHILKGIEAGDLVLLTPPLEAGVVDSDRGEAALPQPDTSGGGTATQTGSADEGSLKDGAEPPQQGQSRSPAEREAVNEKRRPNNQSTTPQQLENRRKRRQSQNPPN